MLKGVTIGMVFGELTVERTDGFSPNGGSQSVAWLCRCTCGNIRRAAESELKRGRIVSCGCKSKSAKKKILGQQFGLWTVLAEAPFKGGRTHWFCRCECGTQKTVATIHLVRGASVSCGCDRPRGPSNPRYKHGSDPSLYGVWCNMIQRCDNPNSPGYQDYGGRGIKICSRWREDFCAFSMDIGSRPSRKHSIDRIDNNRGYEPGNCRWATSQQQMRNTRRNRLVEHDGKMVPLVVATEITGVNYGTARWRLDNGRSDEEALK